MPSGRVRRVIRALVSLVFLATLSISAGATVERQVLGSDRQLILEGAPPIPESLDDTLSRFHDTRSTLFSGWAPDGKGILVKTRFGGINQLHLITQAEGKKKQLTFMEEPIGEVTRQPGGSLIAFAMDEGGSGFDHIFLLNPEQGSVQRLTDGKSLNNRMVWDRQGRLLAYRSTRRNGKSNDIWIMDPKQPGQARLVFKARDGALWKPVDFSRDGKTLLVQYYAGITDSRIYLLNLESGALRLLVGDEVNATSNVASGFDHQDESVLFVTNQRGGAAEIGRAPLSGTEPVAYMRQTITWDVTEFRLSPDRSRGAFITNEEGISRLYLFDPATMSAASARKVPDGVISSLGFSPSGNRLGLTLSSARNPNDAFVLRLGKKPLKSGRIKRWTQDEDGLNPRRYVEPDLVHYPAPMLTSERTILMPAFVYRPRGRGPHPVVIYIHGGPEGQFRPSFNSTIQMWLSTLKVAVIAPNVRGSLGYGERYLSMDDGVLRENSVQDIGALIEWIAGQKEFDASRIAVYGASYGGYMALASSVHFGDRIKAVVNRAGISNFVSYLENTQGYRRDLRRVEYGDERDPEMRAFLQQISPLNHVDRIETPMLIVQGQNDPVVPVSESEQIVNALRSRGLPVWYMNALNEGHSYEKKENKDLFQKVTYLFLQNFLVE
ncbi:MAG: alpha/beta fold hydrolase [Xanthomonadales bacterium]|nr:alpha/beta fold hydrolase [Xanthomonadales bacterium]